MSVAFQVVFDCADPHGLARFWATAMDLEVEDVDALVRSVVDAGYASDADWIEIDGRRAWATAAAARSADGATRLLFQVVPEPKTVKNRVHLDLRVGEDRRDDVVARLVGLGATWLHDGRQGPLTWVTLADPEGNEFCVA